MKLSDYVTQFIVGQGVRHIFMIVGSANAHLVDSIGQKKELAYICPQHEQAAAMMADAYSRVTGNLGVVLTSSGPGGTNALTGVLCAWCDSVPLLVISGQVNVGESIGTRKVRQMGVQELDIVTLVKPVTKYAAQVTDPNTIREHLEAAVHAARSGRPGPAWLDIPLNVQHAMIEPEKLKGFTPAPKHSDSDLAKHVNEALKWLAGAKRPVIIAGGGIKRASAHTEFLQFARSIGAPVVTAWGGIDLLASDDAFYAGRHGVYGQRGANFTLQNADVVLSIGSRLDTRQTSSAPQTFAREAKVVSVEIDPAELHKDWVHIDLAIHADAKNFLIEANKQLASQKITAPADWLAQAKAWQAQYPPVSAQYPATPPNSYAFIAALCEQLREGEVVVTDMGASFTGTMQAFHLKPKQKLFSAYGLAPMGYGLPAAIGAHFAHGGDRVICVSGDGGLQMNIQEFQTLAHYKTPVKLFVLDNRSYLTITQFQDTYFNGRHVASDPGSGYSAPDFSKVAAAYGLATQHITSASEFAAKIKATLETPGPVVCVVDMAENQELIPRLMADRTPEGKYISKPLEDMYPFLPQEEFLSQMSIDPLPDRKPK